MNRKGSIYSRRAPLIITLVVIASSFALVNAATAKPFLQQNVTLQPTSGLPGATVQATGNGWTPAPGAQPYGIYWDDKARTLLGNFEPNVNGYFSTTFTIPSNALPGKHDILFCERCGTEKMISVIAPFSVKEAPTAVPPTIPPITPTMPEPSPTRTPMLVISPMPSLTSPAPVEGPITSAEGFDFITEGPVMQEAFEDGDGDGVINIWDECPNTPAAYKDEVFENGCLCQDSDGGGNFLERGTLMYRYPPGQEVTKEDICVDGMLLELSCHYPYEGGDVGPEHAYSEWEIDCTWSGPDYQCRDGRCIAVGRAIPQICWSSEGTCADGIQNQGEEGVDCGGKCPPCNTHCTTGTIYAPHDTPCTTYYPTDLHRIDWPWTDNELEYTCQFHEVCHPDLDHVIEEATRCCSIQSVRSGMTTEESQRAMDMEINAMPDPDLCRAARRLTGQSANCKKCIGLYIIKGLGEYARWMVGYNWLYPEHNVYGDIEASPASHLINVHKTGICRDYSGALTTLLRKAGFAPQEVGGFCDGAHCYNVVKLPGDREWHVVDTTGNSVGIIFGSLPGGYPYCAKLDESAWCWGGSLSTGGACTGSETKITELDYSCYPGLPCNRDIQSIPAWAPISSQIVGCP